MKITQTYRTTRLALIKIDLQRFRSFFNLLNRRAELERLAQWAKRKRLSGPYSAYRRQLFDEEMRLADYTVRSPRLAFWARLLHNLVHPNNNAPKYPRKKARSTYRAQHRRKL